MWVPEGADLEVVPEAVQRAIGEVVQPVYERFVAEAEDPLEMTLGVTLAHLLWLEVLQQYDLKREYTEITAVLHLRDDRTSAIDQHLRIINSKVQVGYLLARLRELRHKLDKEAQPEQALPEETGWHAAPGSARPASAGGSRALDPSHSEEVRPVEDPPKRGTGGARSGSGFPLSPNAPTVPQGALRPISPGFSNKLPEAPPVPENRESADQSAGPGRSGELDIRGSP